MEEEILVTVFQKKITLSLQDFCALKQIVSLNDLNFVCQTMQIKNIEIEMMHVCLYYIIIVQHELQQKINVKEVCSRKLGEYYMKNKMNFNVFNYSVICSNALENPLDECLHIIFFLVYGRLATKPYVDSLIRKKNKFNATLTQFHSHCITPKNIFTERHFTQNSIKSQQNEAFIQELQTALRPFHLKDKLKIKKRPNIHFLAQKEEEKKQKKIFSQTITKCNVQTNYSFRKLIPCKVDINEKSSLFLVASKQIDHSQALIKKKYSSKLQMRKQKFNQNFNPYQRLFNQNKIKTNLASKIKSQNMYQLQQIKNPQKFIKNESFLQQLIEKIKKRNAHLDEVTTQYSLNRFNPTYIRSFLNQKNAVVVEVKKQQQKRNIQEYIPIQKENCVKTRTSLIHVANDKQQASEVQKIAHRDVLVNKNLESFSGQEHQLKKKISHKRNYKKQYRQFMKTPIFNIESVI